MTFNSQMDANKIIRANVESFWQMIIQDFLIYSEFPFVS